MSKKAVWTGFFVGLLILLAIEHCAFAEGGRGSYTVQNENLVVEDVYGMRTAYMYAEIVNTGASSIELADSIVMLTAEDGSLVTQTTSVRMMPDVLEAGKTGYLYAYTDLLEPEETPTIVKFNVKATDSRYYDVAGCNITEPRFAKRVTYGDRTETFMEALLTNDDAETKYEFTVCFIVKEKDTGKIISVSERSHMNDIGILPGTSVIVRQEMYSMDEIDTDKYDLEVIGYATTFKP